MIDLTKPLRTNSAYDHRQSFPVRLLCSDRKGDYKYVVLIGESETLDSWSQHQVKTYLENVPIERTFNVIIPVYCESSNPDDWYIGKYYYDELSARSACHLAQQFIPVSIKVKK